AIGWTGDTLWVDDESHRRVTVISLAGRVVRSVSYPDQNSSVTLTANRSARFTRFRPQGFSPRGELIGDAYAQTAASSSSPFSGEHVLIRLSANGNGTVIARLPSQYDPSWFMIAGTFGAPVPFAPKTHFDFSPAGNRFAFMTGQLNGRSGGTFTVSAFRFDGE